VYCSDCGNRRESSGAFCAHCGRRLSPKASALRSVPALAGIVVSLVVISILLVARYRLPSFSLGSNAAPPLAERPNSQASQRPHVLQHTTTETSYARIRRSLAMIIATEPDGIRYGSAFSIASTPKVSYFLTNHHVVGDLARVQLFIPDRKGLTDGAVVGIGSGKLDLAVVAANIRSVPAVPLAHEPAIEGQSVAVAGFPSIQFRLAASGLGMSPSMHVGTVNAKAGDGFYIEYDAQTDRGNSGGPLYDVNTGEVYAVVTYGIESTSSVAVQNNLAISVAYAKRIIQSAMKTSPASVIASLRRTPSTAESARLRGNSPDGGTAGAAAGSTADRYSYGDCGAVIDSKTRLLWKLGPDETMTWDQARAWVSSLDVCDAVSWRMPTISELSTLYDPQYSTGAGYLQSGIRYPAHISPLFANIGDGSWGWSGESAGVLARSFNFNQGVATEYDKDNATYTTRAFAVQEEARRRGT
jgi:S1-C subfamily serine protease